VRHYPPGLFRARRSLARNMETYYRDQCGIELLTFLRDEKDWAQLLDVIEAFAMGLPASTPLVQPKMQDMENLLHDDLTTNERARSSTR